MRLDLSPVTPDGRPTGGPTGGSTGSPADLPAAVRSMLTERHLATLTTLWADGRPHVVPVGFTWDDERGWARVITSGTSVKVRNARRGGRAALCQVDGRHWLTLEGTATVLTDPESVRDAEERYARRYRVPRPNPERVVLVVAVQSLTGSW